MLKKLYTHIFTNSKQNSNNVDNTIYPRCYHTEGRLLANASNVFMDNKDNVSSQSTGQHRNQTSVRKKSNGLRGRNQGRQRNGRVSSHSSNASSVFYGNTHIFHSQ